MTTKTKKSAATRVRKSSPARSASPEKAASAKRPMHAAAPEFPRVVKEPLFVLVGLLDWSWNQLHWRELVKFEHELAERGEERSVQIARTIKPLVNTLGQQTAALPAKLRKGTAQAAAAIGPAVKKIRAELPIPNLTRAAA